MIENPQNHFIANVPNGDFEVNYYCRFSVLLHTAYASAASYVDWPL